MTKELSKQICEKCGVPPHYKYIVKFNKNNSPLFTVTKDFFAIGNKSKYKVIEVIRIYPQLGLPENFVKLLELKILTGCSLIGFLILKGVYWGNIRNFLMSLRVFLDNCDKTTAESIKQSIRKAEWKYE